MDFADIAAKREQIDRDLALAAQAAHKPALVPNGRCYYCDARVGADAEFCDGDCRDDYERIEAARVRNGV